MKRVEDRLQQGTETILVVEDDEAILRLASTILEGLGYTVITKQTPDEADPFRGGVAETSIC